MTDSQPGADRQFNNADSFAHAFDQAWALQADHAGVSPPGQEERLAATLAQIADHPFAQADPAMARQVAEFRIRLLGL